MTNSQSVNCDSYRLFVGSSLEEGFRPRGCRAQEHAASDVLRAHRSPGLCFFRLQQSGCALLHLRLAGDLQSQRPTDGSTPAVYEPGMFQDAELDYDAMLHKVRERTTQPVLRGSTAEARTKLRSNGDGELLDEHDCTPVGSTTSAVVAHITPRYALRHASSCFKPCGYIF